MRFTVLITAVVLIVGCSPAGGGGDTSPTSLSTGTSSTAAVNTTATTPDSTSTSQATTTSSAGSTTPPTTSIAPTNNAAPTTTTVPPAAQVRPIWDEWWSLWVESANSSPVDVSKLAEFAPQVDTELIEQFLSNVISADDEEVVLGESHMAVSEAGPDRVEVVDCRQVTPRPFAESDGGLGWEGTFQREGNQWQLIAVSPTFTNCVPKPVANQIIDDWLAYWGAVAEFWNPADPEHPLLEEVATGDYLDFLYQILAEDQANGVYRVTAPLDAWHPEVTAWDSPTTAHIFDCFEVPDGEFGFFNEDGTPAEEPSTPGARAGYAVQLQYEEGVWKVAAVDVREEEVECEFAPTRFGLPVVPSP